MALAKIRTGFERLLEFIVVLLMAVLALEVVVGVVFRMAGRSLVWYDEIASVLLAWLTYYGAALAALKRAHIGCPGVVQALAPRYRLPVTIFTEFLVFAFFALMAWVGWTVLEVLATDFLVSLPKVSVKYTQSVIPISALLFIIAEALNLPDILREAKGTPPPVTQGAAAEVTH